MDIIQSSVYIKWLKYPPHIIVPRLRGLVVSAFGVPDLRQLVEDIADPILRSDQVQLYRYVVVHVVDLSVDLVPLCNS